MFRKSKNANSNDLQLRFLLIAAGMFALLTVIAAVRLISIYTGYAASSRFQQELAAEVVVFQQPVEEIALPEKDGAEGNPVGDSTDLPEIPEEAEEFTMQVNFAKLYRTAPDAIGWICCPGTRINYPVVQWKLNNWYYSNHQPNRVRNPFGSIFADFRNECDFSEPVTIVYGHRLKNNTMFGTLAKYADQQYYEKHPVWYLSTPDHNYRVDLVAGMIVEKHDALFQLPANEETREQLLTRALENSTFTTHVTVAEDAPLVVFSTCTYEIKNGRFVLLGALTEIPSVSAESEES